ncbi:MAG TPA: FAD-binding oxidoreductase [Pseudomonadales bacterium]|nr:FAD-binding oxidoreductase [Pseudomonadales bacterium]
MSAPLRIAVVGKGLIGSAAARHLAEAGAEVLLVGPDEPAVAQGHDGVFASHYDAARITRRLDRDPLWAQLACRSIDRHAELQTASGVHFHHRHRMCFAAGAGSTLLDAVRDTARTLDLPLPAPVDGHAELQLTAGTALAAEAGDAGWIAPRALVKAQTLVALAAGARVVRQPVWALRGQGDGVRLILDDGSDLLADRVLVCAGAFAAPTGLVAGVPLMSEGRTVLLARVEADLLARLADLPCLVMDRSGLEPSDLYLMPPILYPDGHHYVKLGTSAWHRPLDELDALREWFQLPPPRADVEHLTEALHRLLPVLADATLRFDTCAVTATPSGRPYVAWLDGLPGIARGRVAIAGGGNGKAAKSADELGRLGARLVAGADGADEPLLDALGIA